MASVAPQPPLLKCSVCGEKFPPAGLRVGWVEHSMAVQPRGLERPRKPMNYCAKCDPDMRRA